MEIRTPPYRLIDLNPSFYTAHGSPERHGLGVIFDCPCKQETCEWGGKIAIGFANPIDGGPSIKYSEREVLWTRQGETFEDLTLTPSIHAVGHWHGWLRNGMLVSC